MFSKNKNTQPLIPARSSKAEQILETLERSGLDPEHTLLVGSAALILYGAELWPDPTSGKPRPSDIDMLSTARYAEDIYRRESYNDTPVTIKPNLNAGKQTVLELQAQPLSIDLITAPQSAIDTTRYDRRLLANIQSSAPIEGTEYRILPLESIIKAKKGEMPQYDPKVAQDLASARDALAKIKRRR